MVFKKKQKLKCVYMGRSFIVGETRALQTHALFKAAKPAFTTSLGKGFHASPEFAHGTTFGARERPQRFGGFFATRKSNHQKTVEGVGLEGSRLQNFGTLPSPRISPECGGSVFLRAAEVGLSSSQSH